MQLRLRPGWLVTDRWTSSEVHPQQPTQPAPIEQQVAAAAAAAAVATGRQAGVKGV